MVCMYLVLVPLSLIGIFLCNVEVAIALLGPTKFHVPFLVRFFNGWEMGDIIQNMGDVTHFMGGYFYVGCMFIGISYFLTKFGEW